MIVVAWAHTVAAAPVARTRQPMPMDGENAVCHALDMRTYRNDLHGWYHKLGAVVGAGRATSPVDSAPWSRDSETSGRGV